MAHHTPREVVASSRLERLPRLAAIAFASRCAGYALALMRRLPWDNASFRLEHIPNLERCVDRAARYAETGEATVLGDRVQQMERADRDAVREWSEVWDDEYIPWTDALRTAIWVCDAAGAAETVADCVTVLQRTADLLGHMFEDTGLFQNKERVPEALERNVQQPCAALRADFEALEAASRRERWGDETPISPGFFDGEPEAFVLLGDVSARLCELIASRPRVLWAIEWRDLERVVATCLRHCGFDVVLTPPAKDGGRDVIATCRINGKEKTYYVEIKHWVSGKRVSLASVEAFVEVNVREGAAGGLFLATAGFSAAVYRSRTEISRQMIRLGTDKKIVHLCQQFVQRRGHTIWEAERVLPEVLMAETL